uniref:Secreted protein n=1 Tax=Ciona intestinalis TaxID=7719 RepID=H2XTB7_CIOIN
MVLVYYLFFSLFFLLFPQPLSLFSLQFDFEELSSLQNILVSSLYSNSHSYLDHLFFVFSNVPF